MPFINDKLDHYNKTEKAEGVKPAKIISRFTFDVENIMTKMKANIFGQEQALEAIENMLKLIKADISDDERPLYTGLFLGPTGVGKTEIVRLLAEAIYGGRDRFCRIDMNTLASEHYAAALAGAPPGYVGSKEEKTLFDKGLIEGSFSKPGIVLFDEIEKADETVIMTLLNVLDNGRLKISSGDTELDFRNSIIIMTSNIGAKEIIQQAQTGIDTQKGHPDEETEAIIQEKLEDAFAPEFINRIDDILVFNWLGKNPVKQIINQRLAILSKKLEVHKRQVQLSEAAQELMIEKGYDSKYGARSLKRAFRKYVEIPVAEMLLNDYDPEIPAVFYGDVSADNRKLMYEKTLQASAD